MICGIMFGKGYYFQHCLDYMGQCTNFILGGEHSLKKKYDIPFKTRFFRGGVLGSLIVALVFILPSAMLIPLFISLLFRGSNTMLAILLIVLVGAIWGLIIVSFISSITQSYERRQGLITNIITLRSSGVLNSDSYAIELDSDTSVRYKTPSKLGPYVGSVLLTEGNEVEIFYGRRSKVIIMVNVIAEGTPAEKLTQEISEE